jgi:hypothetical protein
MDVEQAALELSKRLGAPGHLVNIMAWHGDAGNEIRVWIGSEVSYFARLLPVEFEGFRVVAEIRPHFKALVQA